MESKNKQKKGKGIFNNNNVFWLMNVYLDSSHIVLKYFKDTEAYICNLLIMTSDFNI